MLLLILIFFIGVFLSISGFGLIFNGEVFVGILTIGLSYLLLRYGIRKYKIKKRFPSKAEDYKNIKNNNIKNEAGNIEKKTYKKHYYPEFDSFVSIDFETTGFSPTEDKIIEIGAIKFIDGEKFSEFNTFVNPKITIPGMITKINGISNGMVKGAPLIDQAIVDLLDFIEDYPIVAHNASFDLGFLLHNSPTEVNNLVIDTLQLCRSYFDFENNKLETVCDMLNIENNSYHRALSDSMATGLIYLKCKHEYDIQNSLNKGKELEKKGKLEEAANYYEIAIANNFEGNNPYDRLAIYYRKNKDYDNEIRVLQKAIFVFENIVKSAREDRLPKLEKFKERLEKTELLKSKVAG